MSVEQKTVVCHIGGMDCPDCANKIEKVLSGLPGVDKAQVDFASETLSAEVSTAQAVDGLQRAVRALGYDITDQPNRLSSVLEVQGMDCAEEKTLVEKALKDLSGLERFEINLMTARLTVVHDSVALPVAQIITALAGVGLKATIFGTPMASGKLWQRHGRLLSTIVAGVFVATGLILHLMTGQEGVWEKSLYVLAIASGGWFIARKGVAAIRHGALDMNFLMTVAVIGALVIDAWDEAAMVVFLFALAQVLEGRAMDRARHAVRALMDLAPPVALRIQGDIETTVAVDQIQIGDVIRIRPGDKIPLDGAIINGRSAVNQAPITGESVPVDKVTGDTVFAGAINGSGSLDVRVSHKSTDTTLAHIIHLIEQAQSARAPAQAFVDRFSKIYTPAVLVLAALVALLPPLLFGQAFGDWFYRALVLLVIACPCALVISTPVAIVSGLARGARAGVLLKGGVHLENAGHLKAIAFDKTGTLTIGRPEVQTAIPLNNTTEMELLRVAASLETRSEHPLALAILDYAKKQNVSASNLEDFQALPGRGVEALVDGERCLLGNHRLFEERGLCTAETESMLSEQERQGQTVVIVGNDRQILGLIAIADSVRPEARGVVTRLHQLGIAHITMLTGDNQGTAWAIAGQLGIDNPKAELLPADKVTAIQQLVKQFDQVGMVGDGVNDAPAMAVATTGIAMGAAGTDVALETADVVLMGDDLTRLPFAIRLSRTTLRVIRSNIVLALGLKAIFLVLAVLGLATLWMAVFADAGASLLVIANSLRLLRIRDH